MRDKPLCIHRSTRRYLSIGLASVFGASFLFAEAAAHAGSPEPAPRAVVVPPALRARVPMLELSGIAWAADIDRYLVVVDDAVDLAQGLRHAPFVLAMNLQGQLDSDIVPIDGVESVDDAEALAAASNGIFYLLTSHAPNRHGKLHAARRQLLEMHLEGRRLRVTGRLDLLFGSDDISKQIAKLGHPENTPVDLEALTFHDGALYIGLKAPLMPDGSAIILRLNRPRETFSEGTLNSASLSFWGSVKLPTGTGGATVNQGVADLLFASDGNLYLCGNAPKGGRSDGGGALWRVISPRGGRMNASLMRRFPGLKPEGAAPTLDGRELTLVFDRDRRDPLWMTWPLAH